MTGRCRLSSIARVWVTRSAWRYGGARKNSSASEAAPPPSSISRAFTWSLAGRLGEILAKAAPELDIDQLVGVAHVSAHDPLPPPAVVDHCLLRRLIGRGYAAVDLVGAELLERLQVGEPLRLPAHPPAADPLVTDDRPELRGGLAVEAVERGETDWAVDPLDLDRPLAVFRLRVPRLLDRPLNPAFRIRARELVLAVLEQVRGGGGRVEPALDGLDVLRTEIPQ